MDKNIKKIKATVLMSVYNGEPYLKEAIKSILQQTFTDFEFFIINDGSTDESEKTIKSFGDKRIRLINNEKNLGLIKSLNKGLECAKGEYIIRMDADDISSPDRIKIQIDFMDKNKQIGMAGSYLSYLHNNKIKKYPTNSNIIKSSLLFYCTLAHPTVIMRSGLINQYNLRYDEKYPHAEDYELWTRAIRHFPITNIKKSLLLHRVHENKIGKIKNEEQVTNSKKIKIKELKNNLKINPTEEEVEIHHNIKNPEKFKIENFIEKKEKWLLKLVEQNEQTLYYNQSEFNEFISFIWSRTCKNNIPLSFKFLKNYWKLPGCQNNQHKKIIFTIKYLFKHITKYI